MKIQSPLTIKARQWIAGLLIFASLFALGQSVYTGYTQNRYSHCQAKINDQLIRALNTRASVSNSDWDALDKLWLDLKASSGDRQKSQEIFDEYLRQRQASNEARHKNPFPSTIAQSC